MKHIPIQTFFDGQGCMSGSSACWNREWGMNEQASLQGWYVKVW